MTRDILHEYEVATQRLDELTTVLNETEKAVEGRNRERRQLIKELLQDGYQWIRGKWIKTDEATP